MDRAFKKAVVIFLDILGTQERTDFADWYRIMEVFSRSVRREKEFDSTHDWTVYKREIHVFSDCAYIIYDFRDGVEEERKNLSSLMCIACYNSEKLIHEFLKNEFIVRGAITCGDIYYDSERNIWFRPAMNRAYYLESKISKFPRIVVDPECAHELFDYNEREYRSTDFQRMANGEIIKADEDGYYYLNYFNTFFCTINAKENLQKILAMCKREKEIARDNPELNKSIRGKYNWIETKVHEALPLLGEER